MMKVNEIMRASEMTNVTRMMKVAIIGGKLQGLEAVYLASKAGIESTLIDKDEEALARNLCTRFICEDILDRSPFLISELQKVDFILPALENEEVLTALVEISREYGFKLAFDMAAYQISSSKLLSDQLMQVHRIPAPRYYPNCEPPYIVKPSTESGSTGVVYVDNAKSLKELLSRIPTDEQWVIQEFISGKAYSIEIIGRPGNYRTYEITELFMDDIYDCMRVEAPCEIGPKLSRSFTVIAEKLAELVSLTGIMDVEVIHSKGQLKVLEIDARLPSQTPTVVYHASGINMVSELSDLFCLGELVKSPSEEMVKRPDKERKYVSYEHLLIDEGKISGHGEHIISQAGPLDHYTNFFGADEALTDYKPLAKTFLGTFINTAKSPEELGMKRTAMFEALKRI